MSYPEEYPELRHYPLHGSLDQAARLADLSRNATLQGLVSHFATRDEAASTLYAMAR